MVGLCPQALLKALGANGSANGGGSARKAYRLSPDQASYELQATRYELQVTSYKLRATSYKLRVTSYSPLTKEPELEQAKRIGDSSSRTTQLVA